MDVWAIIKRKSEDYHGSYDDVLDIYSNRDKAKDRVRELNEENDEGYDTEYFTESFTLIE